MKRSINTAASHRIYNRTERALLRERIHQTRKELVLNDSKLFSTHLLAANKLKTEDWNRVDRITYDSMTTMTNIITTRHIEKFDRLAKIHTPAAILKPKPTVVNLSDYQMSDADLSVLEKGGNYAVTPNNLPVEDIIAQVESAARILPVDTAEEIRRETSRILQHAKPPKNNLTGKEKMALKNLNRNKDIIILPADKGNTTAVLNILDYKQKVMDLLDPNTYKKLPRDPTAQILRQTNKIVKQSSISTEEQRKITRSEALPPRLYGLPKLHKPNVPLRPIVSAIDSPTYAVAKFLSSLLKPHVGNAESHIRNSSHFVEKLKTLTLLPNDKLVSFDVVSLFTMVPLNETLEHLQKIFRDDITAVFRHVLTTTYFVWEQNFYEQVDGVAMGSPLSPSIANFYMEFFEETALKTAPQKPSSWFRFVDDTFVVWSHGDAALLEFLQHLNSIHPRIQFTMEIEKDGQLAFLDVLVNRKKDGSLGHTVYRKPTHTDRYLHKCSNHHPSQKRAMINTLVNRASSICEPQHLQQELRHLDRALQTNGYTPQEIKRALHPRRSKPVEKQDSMSQIKGTLYLPYVKNVTDRVARLFQRHNIRTIFKPTRQICNMLPSANDSRERLSFPGVYRIPCSCGSVYVGTTKRSINTRIKEHKRNCRLLQLEKSAIAEHALSGGNHVIQFNNVDILSNMTHYHPRLQREAIEIHKHRNNFNRKEESLKINKIWYPALQNVKTKPYHITNASTTGSREQDQSEESFTHADQSGASTTELHRKQGINDATETAPTTLRTETATRTLRPRPRHH